MTYVSTPHESPAAAATETSTRLVSLDALRGFDMLWITGGGLLGGALRTMSSESNAALIAQKHAPQPGFHFGDLIYPIAQQLQHVPWEGFHFEDLIFPMFVFIA